MQKQTCDCHKANDRTGEKENGKHGDAVRPILGFRCHFAARDFSRAELLVGAGSSPSRRMKGVIVIP